MKGSQAFSGKRKRIMIERRPPPMRRGDTRLLMLWGAAIASVLFVSILVWPFVTNNQLANPPSGANPNAPDTTIGRGVPAQQAAESAVGKSDPAGQEEPSGGRARAIKQSSQPLSLSQEQIEQIRTVLKVQDKPAMDAANFEMMIGSSVPKQVQLGDLPPELTEIMNGYWGDQYTIVQDKLVIVDQRARRVVAIIPGVT
jgi:uncharacterized protein DUF1236